MIGWGSLIANSAWILGCALALAVLSYASWQASIQHQKLRMTLNQPAFLRWVFLAGILFCAGLAGVSDVWWEIALWVGLAVLFLVQWGYLTFRRS